ncbi:hypothetical protein SeMB42_g02605 [Synchytrium endobioticum]|uniref:Pre-mRNA-splicing factor cwc2 n=1 Tax=Synchytrium endobioticum TaxID=286115 RepID=A0A507DGV3_9FUNG|nr:hypothetical protein SeMB42_g02605 [Synchytrium endobioticum]TPX50631.1 hypothetical protein SeLEV6574_g00801 [Synchytrium endobioticum]
MEYMNRPARKQASGPKGMKQGSGTYNVWYDRWTGEDYKKGGVDKAITRCVIARDAGRTKANWNTASRFCLYFARGCCDKGEECTYLHRVPVASDVEDTAFDCFGRERFRLHRDDMGGVGSIEKESRTLYVGRLSTSRSITDSVKKTFSEWGEIEHLRVFPEKCIAFVRYHKRSNAEFAKEAMYGQSLDSNEVLNVRWAEDDPNPKAVEDNKRKAEDQFYDAARAKMPQLGDKGDVFAYEGYYEDPSNWEGPGAEGGEAHQQGQHYQTPEEYYAAYAAWYAQQAQATGASTEGGSANNTSGPGQQPVPPTDPTLVDKSEEFQAAYWNWYYYMMNLYGGAPPPPGTVVLTDSASQSMPKTMAKVTSRSKSTGNPVGHSKKDKEDGGSKDDEADDVIKSSTKEDAVASTLADGGSGEEQC